LQALRPCFTRSTAPFLFSPACSIYQGDIDWPAVAASGLRFVSIRATEGATYKDPNFAFNWKGAHAAGMFRTAYHFAHPNLPAAAQADFFVDTVAAAGGFAAGTNTTQFMLDLEDANGLAPPAVWAWVQAFIAQIKARTGRSGIIYVGYYFWRDSVGNPASNLDAPLWIASYTAAPSVPSAWPFWTFWQYNDNGVIPGIKARTDVDLFAGDESELLKLCF